MLMDSNPKSRWQVRIAVVTIFVVGFVAGALALNIYRGRQWSSSRALGRGVFEQMLDKLNLSAEQRTQVGEIFDDARAELTQLRKESGPKFREVRERTDERLQSVLTAEQWQEFRQLTSESRRSRQRRMGRERQR
jgi:Spy/CpxP family protein refolding chaperone